MRLNQYLSANGVCSRREADRMIEAGRVSVNGETAQLGCRVGAGDVVEVDHVPVREREREVFLAVNKPRGVVVTTDRSWGDPLLEDIVRYPLRVFPVGRLDKESEGLILMTNNGEAANRIQKAREAHEKEYVVTVDRQVDDAFLKAMRSGVRLEELGRTTRPCRVTKIDAHRFDIILTEGMNRQIRRMCGALGFGVTALRRIRVMNILLGDLPPGSWRELTGEETGELKRMLDAGTEGHKSGGRTIRKRKAGENRGR